MSKSAIFISYRREDCTGYAGRIEDALERAFGVGTVFRDMRDIAAGESFADVIKSGLTSARVVLVLIGPRWSGEGSDGTRRIDQQEDFVRLEVATALASECKVVPVLLSGAELPREEDLPESLRALTQRQALNLHEASWDADMARLIRALGLPSVRRRRALIVAASLLVLALAGAAAWYYKPALPPAQPAAALDDLIGTWQAQVGYGWGDTQQERFVFQRFAGEVTGTASFLEYPRGIEDFHIEDRHLRFLTHTTQSMNDEERELTHRYAAELNGDVLRFRLHTTGGFASYPPIEFSAHRVPAERAQAQ